MSVATLITEGFGSYGNIGYVIKDGLDTGTPANTVIATILTEAFGTYTDRSVWLVTEGFGEASTPPPTPTPVSGGGGGGMDLYRYKRDWELLQKRRKQTLFAEQVSNAASAAFNSAESNIGELALKNLREAAKKQNFKITQQQRQLLRLEISALKLFQDDEEAIIMLLLDDETLH